MFLDQRFPDDIARGSTGGPTAARLKAYGGGGRLAQTFLWRHPKHRFDVSHGIKTVADFERVRAFWYVVFFGGPFEGFRYKDWNDYRADRSNTALLEAPGGAWQLARRYTTGPASFDRPIAKPVDGTVVIYRMRGGVVTVATAVVDYATGLVTITGHAGGDTYTWEGEFDVPVTFADDAISEISLDGLAGHELLGLPSIPLEEVRL